jgi:hypothetical protein
MEGEKMPTQFQFKITDPAHDVPPMAFRSEEERSATLSYVLSEAGVEIDSLAQIVFTRVDDGKFIIQRVLQYGEDVTSRARFA